MATDSKPLLILRAMQALVSSMATPDYHYTAEGRTYRGRMDFDYNDLTAGPVWNVFAYRSEITAAKLTGQYDFRMICGIEAHAVPEDLDNPGDTGINLAGDLLRLIMDFDENALLPMLSASWYNFFFERSFPQGVCLTLDPSSGWAVDLPEPGELIVSARLVLAIDYRET